MLNEILFNSDIYCMLAVVVDCLTVNWCEDIISTDDYNLQVNTETSFIDNYLLIDSIDPLVFNHEYYVLKASFIILIN